MTTTVQTTADSDLAKFPLESTNSIKSPYTLLTEQELLAKLEKISSTCRKRNVQKCNRCFRRNKD